MLVGIGICAQMPLHLFWEGSQMWTALARLPDKYGRRQDDSSMAFLAIYLIKDISPA